MNAPAMTERFEMRLGQSALEAVDQWRAEQDDVPSRSEAVRRLVEIGLDAKADRQQTSLGHGERLIVFLLCDLFKHLKVKSELEPEFLQDVLYNGHYWALNWRYPGHFHSHADKNSTVSEVVDVLDMWYFLERGFAELSKNEKELVAKEGSPFGKYVNLPGFDGNNEAEHLSVARFLVERLDRFVEFKGRDFNSHCPVLDSYRRMLPVFLSYRKELIGRQLNVGEIIDILQARIHPARKRT